MSDYKKIPTSAEVWAVIHARHHGDLIADLLGRVNAAYEQTRAGIGTMVDLIQYACHCDLEYGYEPDTCVLDEGRHQNCIHAMKLVSEGKKRDDCKYWLPISIVR